MHEETWHIEFSMLVTARSSFYAYVVVRFDGKFLEEMKSISESSSSSTSHEHIISILKKCIATRQQIKKLGSSALHVYRFDLTSSIF